LHVGTLTKRTTGVTSENYQLGTGKITRLSEELGRIVSRPGRFMTRDGKSNRVPIYGQSLPRETRTDEKLDRRDAVFQREMNQLGAGMQVQLLHHLIFMEFHCAGRDIEGVAYFLG